MTALSLSGKGAAGKPIWAKRDLNQRSRRIPFFLFFLRALEKLRFKLKILNMAERYFRALILPNF